MDYQTPTGLKELIQSLAPKAPGVIEGTVTNASPLQITLANDSKMVLGKNSLIVPRHLTDYMVKVDLQKSAGSLVSQTTEDDGMLHVYNSLKKGDTVYLLHFNSGKKYYILDRKG